VSGFPSWTEKLDAHLRAHSICIPIPEQFQAPAPEAPDWDDGVDEKTLAQVEEQVAALLAEREEILEELWLWW
jgi:hypothetical protein